MQAKQLARRLEETYRSEDRVLAAELDREALFAENVSTSMLAQATRLTSYLSRKIKITYRRIIAATPRVHRPGALELEGGDVINGYFGNPNCRTELMFGTAKLRDSLR